MSGRLVFRSQIDVQRIVGGPLGSSHVSVSSLRSTVDGGHKLSVARRLLRSLHGLILPRLLTTITIKMEIDRLLSE